MKNVPAQLDDLILRATSGDSAATESLLLHYHDPLLHFIGAKLAAPDSADFNSEDLLQETLIEVFRGIKGLEARGNAAFFSWLKTIARSRYLNRIKARGAAKRGGNHKRVVPAQNAQSTATSILYLIVGPEATPSAIVRRREAVSVIAMAVGRLDPDRRRIIELRYGDGMSLAEVAAEVGKSEGAVKMLISRILKELHEAVKADFKDFSAGA